MLDAKLYCDQTGELLSEGFGQGNRARGFLTLKGSVVLQLPPGEMSVNLYGEPAPFHFLTEKGKTYAFRDATAMADWLDDRIEKAGFTPLEDLAETNEPGGKE